VGYLTYCSSRCSSKHNGAGKKLGALVKTEAFKKNRNKVLLEKYGTNSMVELNADKIKLICLDRYGVDHPLKSKEIRQKRDEAVLKKYGVSSILLVDDIKAKIKQTCIERYGSESPLSNLDIINKSKTTRLSKFKSGILTDRLDLISEKNLVRQLDWVIDDFTGTRTQKYRWIHECGYKFTAGLDAGKMPSCPKCNKIISKVHYELIEFCESLGLKFTINDNTIISPRQVDLYFKDLNLGIEVNGVYWHSDEKKDKNYHEKKTDELLAQGIKLIHVFEDEWWQKKEIIKRRLLSVMGLDKKIYARKCTLVEVSPSDAKIFCETYHLQGSVNSKFKYGLIYDEELVALMTFGKPRRWNKGMIELGDWELLRYVSKFTIVGGASKLLSEFRRNNKGSIVSYAAKNWSSGNLYEKLGFTLRGNTGPGYFYVDLKGKLGRVSRQEAQKHKLPALLGDQFNEAESETENMKRVGYVKIYDSGNLVYIMD